MLAIINLFVGKQRYLFRSHEERVNIVIEPLPNPSLTVGNTASLMHLIKGNVGTGILAMPSAIKYAGLWVGFFGIGIIGMIATHCMHLLVHASKRLCVRFGKNTLDYGEVAEYAVYDATQSPKLGKIAKLTVNVFICITQFGFCTVYVLFVAQNIKQFIEHFTGKHLPLVVYEAAVLLCLIPYTFVKSLKYLAPFSVFANCITFVGLAVVLQYCVHDMPSLDIYPAFNSWKDLPLYFGIAIYAFEGIAVVLPVENKMKTPADFRGLAGVLNTSMVIVTVLYMAVGFYGYIKFGDSVQGSVTLNLPSDQWLNLSAKLLFALAIFISYGIQFYVPAYAVFPGIAECCCNCLSPVMADYILRIIFCTVTFGLAAVVPHLDLMISLIGALASSALALIFPPLIDIITQWPDNLGKFNWKLVKNIAIAVFGIIGFFTGTITSVMKIIETF